MPSRALPGAGRAASMSLLADLETGSLDAGYREAAVRRDDRRGASRGTSRGTGSRAGRGDRRLLGAAGLLLVGLLAGTAAADVRGRAAEAGSLRVRLLDEVQRRTAQSDRLARQADALRTDVSALQQQLLRQGDQRAAARLTALELAAGTVPVTGPGVVVRLDDAPRGGTPTDGRGGQIGAGRVQDRDLQDAVNGLWAAGAEAVSINDLRLTALTAIRSAGEAVLVDFRPLSPPYLVRAVGDPEGLARRFTSGPQGRRLATYPGLYGLGFGVRTADRLQLPAAGLPPLDQSGLGGGS